MHMTNTSSTYIYSHGVTRCISRWAGRCSGGGHSSGDNTSEVGQVKVVSCCNVGWKGNGVIILTVIKTLILFLTAVICWSQIGVHRVWLGELTDCPVGWLVLKIFKTNQLP